MLWAQHVDQEFHARFSAQSRRYQYWIHNGAERSGIFAGLMTHYPHPLDYQLMHDAAQSLLGEQDFTSFRALAPSGSTQNWQVLCIPFLSIEYPVWSCWLSWGLLVLHGATL